MTNPVAQQRRRSRQDRRPHREPAFGTYAILKEYD